MPKLNIYELTTAYLTYQARIRAALNTSWDKELSQRMELAAQISFKEWFAEQGIELSFDEK